MSANITAQFINSAEARALPTIGGASVELRMSAGPTGYGGTLTLVFRELEEATAVLNAVSQAVAFIADQEAQP